MIERDRAARTTEFETTDHWMLAIAELAAGRADVAFGHLWTARDASRRRRERITTPFLGMETVGHNLTGIYSANSAYARIPKSRSGFREPERLGCARNPGGEERAVSTKSVIDTVGQLVDVAGVLVIGVGFAVATVIFA